MHLEGMMPMTARLGLALLLALAAASAAADEPKAFACSFAAGVTHSYEKGQFAAEPASPLAFGIAAIDARAQVEPAADFRGAPKHADETLLGIDRRPADESNL